MTHPKSWPQFFNAMLLPTISDHNHTRATKTTSFTLSSIMTEAQQKALFDKVEHALRHTSDDDRPVVLMTCGLAGMSCLALS